nr:ATP-binding protein [Azomonas macrocytogenes]
MLTLLPSTLLALVLGVYFTRAQLLDMRDQLHVRGELIARQLAPLVAPALDRSQDRRLQRILNDVLNQPDVRTIILLNPDRTLRAHSGPNMLTPSPHSDPLDLTQASGTDTTRILMPVLGRHLHLADDRNGIDTRLIGWLELEMSHEGTLLRGYRRLFTSLMLVGASLLITGLLAIRMSRTITLPLLRIKLAVAQLKEGHLETRLPPLGSHEMDELASGINSMAEALFSGREELQQSIDQATEDVRQNLETIEIQNIELDLARKEALEASRIKSEFLANISHEIRTPLNSILGFTRLLQKSELVPRQQDYLATIEKSADNLLDIINEILDFSKIEAGKLVLENIPFNLRDVIEDAMTMLAPTAHTKQLELICLIYRDTPLQLIGDPLRLKQVLTNLISNAVKFTSQGDIVVRAMVEEESNQHAQLRISVQDTGIGLDEQEIRMLFQAFTQTDNSLSRQPGGTGLGLVISKRLIEQMGGEIGVSSSPGEGSTFWICLNLDKAYDDAVDHHRSPLPGGRVALLEPNLLTRQALQHQLEDLNLQVMHFETLEILYEAVSTAHQANSPIDFALLDFARQQECLTDLPQYLKQLEAFGCKVLLLCEQAPHQKSLLDYPARLLAKPVCTRKLQEELTNLVGRHLPALEKLIIPHAPRILCVDDNAANLLLVETLLSDMGAEVEAIDNGMDAFEAVKHKTFDLVFMDMQMPGMDGRQTTEAIRQWENEHNNLPLPIVALTAHALASEKRLLLQDGLDDYMTKPINERQLAQVVLKWTGLSLQQKDSSQPEQQALSDNSHSVLDAEEGLRLAAGKADLAKDMLGMLLASLPADRQAIRQARAAGNHQTLIDHVHRLHGATRYCGVPQLRTACQRSETLLKQDHIDAQLALDELDTAIARLARETGVDA